MPQADWREDLAEATRRGPQALFSLLSERLQDEAGFLLLTVLAPDRNGGWLNRLFSSDEENYPLGPADKVEDTAWFRHLFGRGKPVVANDAAEISAWLPDYTDYAAQGYGALANLPIVADRQVIGIVNVMGANGHFTPERLRSMSACLPVAALAVLIGQTMPATLAFPGEGARPPG